MTRVVVLLRGVNVGGRNRLPMADLRAALEADGLRDVRTYIQSGNVVLDTDARTAAAAAARVRAVIARDFGLDVPAIAITADELTALAEATPYAHETDPKRVHAIVLETEPSADIRAAVQARQDASSAAGSRDSVTVVGRVAYLHTPDGFGDSVLAKALTSSAGPLSGGTARNWSTVAALLDLCSH